MELATRAHEAVSHGPASTFTIAIGCWPVMVATLLLAVAGHDAESRLSEDLVLARRLATVLREDAKTKAALSQLLFEPPGGETTIPHVEVELASWTRMRASMLIRAVAVGGSIPAASMILDIPARQLRRALRCAHRHMRRSHRRRRTALSW